MIKYWYDIPGYKGLYKISPFGDIKSLDRVVRSVNKKNGRTQRRVRGKLLKPTESHNGYLEIQLSKEGKVKKKRVHRLVAEAFVANPECKPEVNHKDGNKKNNFYRNLEWATRKENESHALQNGLKPNGENCGKSKLSAREVKEIREKYKPAEYSLSDLAEEYNVTSSNISAIINRKTWVQL